MPTYMITFKWKDQQRVDIQPLPNDGDYFFEAINDSVAYQHLIRLMAMRDFGLIPVCFAAVEHDQYRSLVDLNVPNYCDPWKKDVTWVRHSMEPNRGAIDSPEYLRDTPWLKSHKELMTLVAELNVCGIR